MVTLIGEVLISDDCAVYRSELSPLVVSGSDSSLATNEEWFDRKNVKTDEIFVFRAALPNVETFKFALAPA